LNYELEVMKYDYQVGGQRKYKEKYGV